MSRIDQHRSRSGAHRPVILMIEDHEGVRALVRSQLADGGYDFRGAASGEEGLHAAIEQPPDVLLLDLKLPGELQGSDVLEAFRADERLAHIPVIVLTGSGGPDTLSDSLARGAHDFLVKDYASIELLARVAAAVRLKSLHDGLRDANDRLAREALEDPLTGLGNRRHGEIELERMRAHALRHDEGFAVVQIDVDEFKQINDAHGHATGDELLQTLAARLATALRSEDVLVRWGGDEFIALLPEAASADAWGVAQRLAEAARRAGEQLTAPVAATVSIGWACLDPDAPEDLLLAADAALYEAKRAGRDAVRPLAA